jgi:hypothetical protein
MIAGVERAGLAERVDVYWRACARLPTLQLLEWFGATSRVRHHSSQPLLHGLLISATWLPCCHLHLQELEAAALTSPEDQHTVGRRDTQANLAAAETTETPQPRPWSTGPDAARRLHSSQVRATCSCLGCLVLPVACTSLKVLPHGCGVSVACAALRPLVIAGDGCRHPCLPR